MKNKSFPKKYFGENISLSSLSKEELDKILVKSKKKTIVEFIKNLPQKARILDAGCGKGKTINIIKIYRPDIDIYGVDISDIKKFLPKGVNFNQLSVEEVGDLFKENFFDAIICQHVLEHLLNPIEVMRGFKKILRNNGLLYIETPNWIRVFMPFSSSFFWNDYTHLRVFSKKTFERLFFDYSFDTIKIISIPSTDFMINRAQIRQISNIYKKNRYRKMYFVMRFIRTIIARAFDSFFNGTLVAIGINKK